MRVAALRKEIPGRAKAHEPAPRTLSVFRRLSSVTKLPSSADYEPPPLRLGRASLDRSPDACQPLSASSISVSSPHDAAEKEATITASKVVRMPARNDSTAYVSTATNTVFRVVKPARDQAPFQIKERAPGLPRSALTVPLIARSPVHDTIQPQAATQTRAGSGVAANINASMTGGEPLPIGVRQFMEPRFDADFSNVRIHKSGKAASLNEQLSARAFTTRNHIFFGQDKFKPDSAEGKELIAHELTHTIQQGAAVQRVGKTTGIHRAADDVDVHRSEETRVNQRQPSMIQRFLGIDIPDPLDWLAGKANIIPGFRMFTIILGVNPINMSSVDRSAANILRALVEFMPGGGLVTEALDNNGVFDKAAGFVQQQVEALGMTGAAIKAAVDEFISSLSLPGDLLHPGETWERAKRIFTGPIDQLKEFAVGLVTGIIELIKDAILKPIAKLAEGTNGYALLKAVMGKDPITGDPVPQTAEAIIEPFLKLIGQEEIWENMKKANAIPRAFAWFKGALSELMGFVNEIPGLFVAAVQSLELADIILVPRAFAKLASVFGDFLGRFTSWVGDKIWKLLEIIFDVVSPGAFGYVKKTGAALKSILKNPIPFLGNLVKAAKLGFQNFAGNFLTHLKRGLIDWLTGSLPGVYIPKALSLPEVGKFALSVLGISWAQIRAKIVKALGPKGETIMQVLEGAFDVIVALVRGGPAAAWEVIKEKLTNLKDQVISGITSFIIEIVVTKAIPKLIAMFIPGAGFIPAIISIYDTIMVFVNKIKKIIQVVTAFIDSIVAIANGAIGGAAARVESVLAGLLSLAISFLAGFVGLGKVADKVMGVIGKVRATVDKAIDTAIAWIVSKAQAFFKSLKKAAGKLFEWWKQKKSLKAEDGTHSLYFSGQGKGARLMVASAAVQVTAFIASKAADAKTNPAKQAAIAAIGPLVAKIESLEQLPDDQQQARESEFKQAFNDIGMHLITLLSETEWGTEANPLPLEYTKRRAGGYPVLFLGPKSANRIPQSTLASGAIAQVEALLTDAEKTAWKSKGQKITQYTPTTSKALPDGGGAIGISAEYRVEVGKKVLYKPGSTAGGGLINAALRPYGYRAQSEGKDGDHIVEMQIGGPNILPNLWPLDKGENRSSGAALAGRRCKKPDGTEIGISEANKKKNNTLWLIIVKTT